MPSLPKRLCVQGHEVPGGQQCPVCIRSNQRTRDAQRASSSARGYNRRWYRFRAAWLAGWDLSDESSPTYIADERERLSVITQRNICADPDHRHPGEVRGTEDVDHIIPHRGDQRLLFDPSNLQGLCHTCHSAKTAREGARPKTEQYCVKTS
jgi:5-methylcytosine-specific restriction protein A